MQGQITAARIRWLLLMTRVGRYLDPPLTVIAQPTEAMGRCAEELLLARLNTRSESRKSSIEVFPGRS